MVIAVYFHGEVVLPSKSARPLVFIVEVETVGPAEIIHEFVWRGGLNRLVGMG